MVSGSLIRYTPPASFNLLDLSDDILGLIWAEKLKLEKTERRKSLIARHGWRFSCIWGGEGREEKDADYRSGKSSWETHAYDPYFLINYLEKGKDVEECRLFYWVKEKLNTTSGLVMADECRHNLSSLDVYEVEDFWKMYFFYERLIDALCWKFKDDCYDEYKWEQMEEINPFLDARDGDLKYGECEIQLTLGKENKQIYDALTEAAQDWANENFYENDNNSLFSPVVDMLDEVLDDMGYDTVKMTYDTIENYIHKWYDTGQLYDTSETEFGCGLWCYLFENGVKDPYSIIDYLKKEYK